MTRLPTLRVANPALHMTRCHMQGGIFVAYWERADEARRTVRRLAAGAAAAAPRGRAPRSAPIAIGRLASLVA